MKKSKGTKRALLSSVLALVMCLSMLVGSTFAWFTDSVVSEGNKIQAGTLDIDLLMWTSATDSTEITDAKEPLFGTAGLAQNSSSTLWEPGKTQVVYLSLQNNGSLDLKYKVDINVKNPDGGKNLYKVMEYAIIPDAKFGTVTSWANGIDVVLGANATTANNVKMAAGDEHFFALAVHMDEDANNDYQGGSVEFDIKVEASQVASESDSFGVDYDKLATYDNIAFLVNSITMEEPAQPDEPVTITNEDETFKVETISGDEGKVVATIEPANATEAVFEAVSGEGKSLVSYNINVTGQKEGEAVTFELFVGKNLQNVVVFHKGAAMDSAAYSYSATTGYVTVTTTDFSPFEVAFHYADNVPLAKVTALDPQKVSATLGMGGAASEYNLDIGYIFSMMQTAEEAAASEYANYHADFVVSVDKDVAANAAALLGYYAAYCDDYNQGNWVAMVSDEVLPADTEVRLVQMLLNGSSINYKELGEWVKDFKCGASMLDKSVVGTTLTVELRLYETKDAADTENNTTNEETGEYFTVCTYNYTFK